MKIRSGILALLLSLVVGGLVCNKAEAADAPAFNAANFPEYKTDRSDTYSFGPRGTTYWGFLGSTSDRYWELHSTGLLVEAGPWSSTGGNYNNGNDGSAILSRGEAVYSSAHFDNATRNCMKTKPVSTSGDEAINFYDSDNSYWDMMHDYWSHRDGVGSIANAHTWVPSLGEYRQNGDIYNYLDDYYGNLWWAAWTRSYAAYNLYDRVGGYKGHHAYAVGNQKSSVKGWGTFLTAENGACAHLAFQLDLTKVLLVKTV